MMRLIYRSNEEWSKRRDLWALEKNRYKTRADGNKKNAVASQEKNTFACISKYRISQWKLQILLFSFYLAFIFT